jgi:hypothetical protein
MWGTPKPLAGKNTIQFYWELAGGRGVALHPTTPANSQKNLVFLGCVFPGWRFWCAPRMSVPPTLCSFWNQKNPNNYDPPGRIGATAPIPDEYSLVPRVTPNPPSQARSSRFSPSPMTHPIPSHPIPSHDTSLLNSKA